MRTQRHILWLTVVWLVATLLPAEESAAGIAVLYQRASALYAEGNYLAAKRDLEIVIRLCARYQQKCEGAWLNLGAAEQALGNPAAAARRYREAVRLAHQNGSPVIEAQSLQLLGNLSYVDAVKDDPGRTAARQAELLGEAKQSLEIALRLYRDARQPRPVADVSHTLAEIQSRLSNYPLALAHCRESIAGYHALGLPKEAADAASDCALFARSAGDVWNRAKFIERAIETYDRLGATKDLAQSWSSAALAGIESGGPDGAIEAIETALPLYQSMNDRPGLAGALALLGTAYIQLGEYEFAREALQQVLRTVPASKPHCASVWLQLGIIARAENRLPQARTEFERAMALMREIPGNPKEDLRRVLCNLAAVDELEGHLPAALASYRKNGCDLGAIGRAQLAMKDYTGALESFARFQAQASAANAVEPMAAAAVGIGLSQEGLGNLDAAAEQLGKLAATLERVREATAAGFRARFFEAGTGLFPRTYCYEALVRVLVRASKPAEAFRWAEAGKARLLLDAIGRAAVARPQDASRPLEAELTGVTQQISATWERVWAAGAERNEPNFDRLKSELLRLREKEQTLIARLEHEDPEYAAIRYPRPLPVSEIVLHEDEVLLEFQVTDRRTLAFLVRPGKLEKAVEIDISRTELEQLTNAYRRPFVEAGQRGDVSALQRLDLGLGKRLYDLLLKPLLAEVKPAERVLLVPDQFLGVLPFEALVEQLPGEPVDWTDQGHGPFPTNVRFVGDRRVFTYWQSASALSAARRVRKAPLAGNLLVLADPVFSKQDPRLHGIPAKAPSTASASARSFRLRRQVMDDAARHLGVPRFDRLPGTGAFSDQLKQRYGSRVRVLSGLDANETALKHEPFEHYGAAVLFATHGILDDRVPNLQQAALVLSNPEATGEDPRTGDGLLTMREIMNLKMPTELAAALACETGLGSGLAGEGVMNLGRAFQFAGARSALVSLWSVEDESTNLLGEKLVDAVCRGGRKDEAMLAARAMLRERGYGHPFYWAGFILVGERNVQGGLN